MTSIDSPDGGVLAAPSRRPHRSRRILDLIAAFKFVKAATLIAAALAGFGLLNPRVQDWASDWLERLALGSGPTFVNRLAARALPAVDGATPGRLVLVSLAALAYAAVFVVEGVGLIRERRWAEYLTIGVTSSLVPFEAVALAHKASNARAATLAINIMVVAYLIWRLRTDRGDDVSPAG